MKNRISYLSLFIILILCIVIMINITIPLALCLENNFEEKNYSFIENWHDSLFWLNVTCLLYTSPSPRD